MAILIRDVLRMVRLRHPAYRPDVVPNRVLIEAWSLIQRDLAQAGTRAYSGFLVQSIPVYLDLAPANALATVAAGSSGGLPVQDTSLTIGDSPAGSSIGYDLDEAVVVLNDFVPTGVGALTVTLGSAGRTVNGDANAYLWITDGPGAGRDALRRVASNTADTWTLDRAFTTVPVVGQSVLRLIQLPAAELLGLAITETPALTDSVGYLVRLSATGQPYVDVTKPLVASLRAGMPLPPHDRLIGLDLNRASGDAIPILPGSPGTIPIAHHNNRATALAWVDGGKLYLNGSSSVWTGITGLELIYVPIPPLFDAGDRAVLDAAFLLPDSAFTALVEHGCSTAALWAAGKGLAVQVEPQLAKAEAVTASWLASLGQRATALERRSRRNR